MKKKKSTTRSQKHGKYFCLSYIRIVGIGTAIAALLIGIAIFSHVSTTRVLGASTWNTSPAQCRSLSCLFENFFFSIFHPYSSSIVQGGTIRLITPSPQVSAAPSVSPTPLHGCYYIHSLCPMYACRVVSGKTICPPCKERLVCPTGYPQGTSVGSPLQAQ